MFPESQPDCQSLLQQIGRYSQRTAIIDESGEHTYRELRSAAHSVASGLLSGKSDLAQSPVVFLIPPSFHYAAVLFGIWSAGGIAVPVRPDYPLQEIQGIVRDSRANLIVARKDLRQKLDPIFFDTAALFRSTCELLSTQKVTLPRVTTNRMAMIIYTSGTTSRPKGVVSTHRNISAQIRSLATAWEWSCDDRILNVLPLNHIHGIINVVSSALWSGATCQMMERFRVEEVFEIMSRGESTLFMAVPTIYVKLISHWKTATESKQGAFSAACSKMRLMISGSAALPVSVLEEWRSITGHTLLERYGMTEVGMVLSNPLRGTRRPGYVGTPLPGVEVILVDENAERIGDDDVLGEIFVRGDTVFKKYWEREETTRRAFHQGWFRTGDMAIRKEGYFRIQGRKAIDIIKSGGYKVSALEIEETLRTHPSIRECAVVGIDDREWGQRVAVAVIPKEGEIVDFSELRHWSAERMSRQKIPTRMLLVEELPRNSMGKVVKQRVSELFKAQNPDLVGDGAS